jgi:hypothetical protein
MTAAIDILQSTIIGLGDVLLCIGALVFLWLIAAEGKL